MNTLVAFARYLDEHPSNSSVVQTWGGVVGSEVEIMALPRARIMLKHAYHATSFGGSSEYCLSNLASNIFLLKRGNIELKDKKNSAYINKLFICSRLEYVPST